MKRAEKRYKRERENNIDERRDKKQETREKKNLFVLGPGREGSAKMSPALYVYAPYVRRKKGKHCYPKKR